MQGSTCEINILLVYGQFIFRFISRQTIAKQNPPQHIQSSQTRRCLRTNDLAQILHPETLKYFLLEDENSLIWFFRSERAFSFHVVNNFQHFTILPYTTAPWWCQLNFTQTLHMYIIRFRVIGRWIMGQFIDESQFLFFVFDELTYRMEKLADCTVF